MLEVLYIVNRSQARAQALEAICKSKHQLSVVHIVDLADAEATAAAVSQSDIVCTCTNADQPLFDGSWLKPSAHINAVGSYTPVMRELDAASVAKCWITYDTSGALASGDLKEPLESGLISPAANGLVQVGEVLRGQVPVPQRGSRCTLFKSVGTAAQDVITAQAVVEQAKSSGEL